MILINFFHFFLILIVTYLLGPGDGIAWNGGLEGDTYLTATYSGQLGYYWRAVEEAFSIYIGLGEEWDDFRGRHVLFYVEGNGSSHYSVIMLSGYGTVAVVLLVIEEIGAFIYGCYFSLHLPTITDDSRHRLYYCHLGSLVSIESPFHLYILHLLQLGLGSTIQVVVEREEDREEQF